MGAAGVVVASVIAARRVASNRSLVGIENFTVLDRPRGAVTVRSATRDVVIRTHGALTVGERHQPVRGQCGGTDVSDRHLSTCYPQAPAVRALAVRSCPGCGIVHDPIGRALGRLAEADRLARLLLGMPPPPLPGGAPRCR